MQISKKLEWRIEKVVSFFIGLFTIGFYNYVKTSTHHEMVEGFCTRYTNCTYSTFKLMFCITDWGIDRKYKYSLFMDNKTQIHASIIEFNGVGYKLNSYGLWRANRLIKKEWKRLAGRNHQYSIV